MSVENKKKNIVGIEVVAAVTMGILALGCFAIQIFSMDDKTTNTEVALFNTLQFFLTIAFSWFSTRAISKSEFETNLKKHAVSSYRRISDIDSMLMMLKAEVGDILKNKPSSETADIRVIDALISSTSQVVCSSTDDWADIIGEEILSVEKLKRLERDKEDEEKRNRLSGKKNSEDSNIKSLEKSIEQIKSSLPKSLARETFTRKKDFHRTSIPTTATFFANKHKFENGLRLKFVVGSGYSDEENSEKIDYPSIKIMTREKQGEGINLRDEQGNILGRILNPVPGGYDEAAQALEHCYGAYPINVEYIGKDEEYIPELGDFPHHFIKVKDTPKIEKEP